MGDQTERDATLREIAKKNVAYRLPGTGELPAPRSTEYRAASGRELPMQVYGPLSHKGPAAPVVLVPIAYPDPEAHVRHYGPVTSWAQLIAASGMAAVIYGTEAPEEDVHAVLRHLRAEAKTLALDGHCVGVFAGSGNVTVGLSAVMRDRGLRCAALLYGYTMDLDGSTAVAEMSAQFGFVNACAGKSVDDLPDDVPMLFVRAGRDQFPGLNEALDAVVTRALGRNLPITLVNHAAGQHGFDLDEDTPTSRCLIEQILTFLQRHLETQTTR